MKPCSHAHRSKKRLRFGSAMPAAPALSHPFGICVRAMGLREARYLGLRKTHLHQRLTAVAINVVRIDAS
jgi:hypothetical protein